MDPTPNVPPDPYELKPDSQTTQPSRSITKRLIVPILLMSGPALLLVLTVISYGIINLLTQTSTGVSDPNATSPALASTNIILFLLGALSLLAGVPCFILGLILLIKRNSKK